MQAHIDLQAEPSTKNLCVAIIIITYNRRESLAQTCREVAEKCKLAPHEVIIVDQGPEHDHGETIAPLLQRGISTKYIYSGYKCVSAARNVGVAHTLADVVLFLDDDVDILGDIVAAHVAAYDLDQSIAGTVGHVIVEPYSEEFVRLNTTTPSGQYVTHGRGCHMSFRTSVLREIGGFSFGLCSGDESEVYSLLQRRKMRIGNCPSAIVKHLVKPGGMRSIPVGSFAYNLILFRDNICRIGRLHGLFGAIAQPWLRFSNTRRMLRSSASFCEGIIELWRTYLVGLELARIASSFKDHIPLSVALSDLGSGIQTPYDIAKVAGRAVVRQMKNQSM